MFGNLLTWQNNLKHNDKDCSSIYPFTDTSSYSLIVYCVFRTVIPSSYSKAKPRLRIWAHVGHAWVLVQAVDPLWCRELVVFQKPPFILCQCLLETWLVNHWWFLVIVMIPLPHATGTTGSPIQLCLKLWFIVPEWNETQTVLTNQPDVVWGVALTSFARLLAT